MSMKEKKLLKMNIDYLSYSIFLGRITNPISAAHSKIQNKIEIICNRNAFIFIYGNYSTDCVLISYLSTISHLNIYTWFYRTLIQKECVNQPLQIEKSLGRMKLYEW